MIAGVVFDMDGILVDSEKYWHSARVDFAHSLDKEWSADDQSHLMGSNTREWAVYTQQRLALTDMPIEQIVEAIRGRLLPYYENNLPIMPGAIEAVNLIVAHYPIALASGSAPWAIDAIMRLTGLGNKFAIRVSADEVGRGKPSPDVFLEAAQRLGLPPDQLVGIEDSGNGIRALKAAGMKVIAVPTVEIPLTPEVLALADVVLPTLESLTLAMLQSL